MIPENSDGACENLRCAKFGELPAASTRNSISSAKRRSMRRQLNARAPSSSSAGSARAVRRHTPHPAQVQIIDHIADEVDQMILGQPFTQAGTQQKVLFGKVPTVPLPMTVSDHKSVRRFSKTRCDA